MLSTQLIGGARRPESLILRTSAGEQECAVLTILMCDRNGNPAGFFSLVSPLFASANPRRPPVRDRGSRQRGLNFPSPRRNPQTLRQPVP